MLIGELHTNTEGQLARRNSSLAKKSPEVEKANVSVCACVCVCVCVCACVCLRVCVYTAGAG